MRFSNGKSGYLMLIYIGQVTKHIRRQNDLKSKQDYRNESPATIFGFYFI